MNGRSSHPIESALTVHDSLPSGGFESRPWAFLHDLEHRQIRDPKTDRLLGSRTPYHHCQLCGGFIAGYPVEERVHTLGVLSGRDGFSYSCARCGYELGFNGKMA